MGAYLNHSCDPNCEVDEIKGRVWLFALRNIAPGEELVWDYNLYDDEDPAPCHCGSRKVPRHDVLPRMDGQDAATGSTQEGTEACADAETQSGSKDKAQPRRCGMSQRRRLAPDRALRLISA